MYTTPLCLPRCHWHHGATVSPRPLACPFSCARGQGSSEKQAGGTLAFSPPPAPIQTVLVVARLLTLPEGAEELGGTGPEAWAWSSESGLLSKKVIYEPGVTAGDEGATLIPSMASGGLGT